eukprot:12563439-Alexandrium_andersonii.AAC.1
MQLEVFMTARAAALEEELERLVRGQQAGRLADRPAAARLQEAVLAHVADEVHDASRGQPPPRCQQPRVGPGLAGGG